MAGEPFTAKAAAKVGLTFLALAAGVYLVLHVKVALVLTLASAMLACALHHGVDLLRRQGLRRAFAIWSVVVAVMAAGATVLLLLLPPAVGQAKALVTRAPELAERAQKTRLYRQVDRRFHVQQQLEQLRSEAPAKAATVVQPGLRVLGGALSALGAVVAVWGVTIFMLFFGERLVGAILDETLPSHRDRYRRVLHKIYRAVGGYLSGLTLICGCNAACTTAFLAIARVPFFLPLGLLSGMSSLVPLVGNTAVGTLITLVALATGGWSKGIACAVFFILYQQFENHVLGPLVYRRTVNVNPLIIVLGLLAFAELGGVMGAVLAVPAIASAQIVARELLAYRREALNVPKDGPLQSPA
ncbi:MAG TPA: AI-2E family transporter [Myxococcales bacterium]|jgi:predicted PurR-regulated permease PerM|nr:AI-2E family transporter [Myxococcales bacterium]